MSDSPAPAANPYAVPLASLEQEVRVAPERQIEETDVAADAAGWAYDEQRRQAQLAGGA